MSTWLEIIERVRKENNGVMRVDLYFGHDGDNVCSFSTYEKVLTKGCSGYSMQDAVERCYAEWNFMQQVSLATRYGDLYDKCSRCGLEKWEHQHAELKEFHEFQPD